MVFRMWGQPPWTITKFVWRSLGSLNADSSKIGSAPEASK